MIQIKSIKMSDFGRHKKIDDKFNGHVIGLSGPNGKGKSTVLQALQLALTGTIDHPDALREFIRRSGEDNPPKAAQVEVEFVADGKHGRIVRRITPTTTSRKLYWDGDDKPITSEKKVASLLFDILGVDKKAINSTVFISQGEMNHMFKQETDRRGFYTKLLMLGHLAKIGNIAETHRAHIADSVQDLGAVRDAADSAYNEAAEYFDTVDQALRSFPDVAAPLRDMRKLSSLFNEQDEADDSLRRIKHRIAAIPGMDPENGDEQLAVQKLSLEDTREQIETATLKKNDWFKANTSYQELHTLVRSQKETNDKFVELREAETKLADHGEAGDDPASLIQTCKSTLADIERKSNLEIELPGLLATSKAAIKDEGDHRIELEAAEKAHQQYRDEYLSWKADLDVRKKIQDDIDAKHISGDCGCPVCGSDDPDGEFLARTIAEADHRVAALKPLSDKATERVKILQSALEDKVKVTDAAGKKYISVDEDLKRLNVTLVLTNKSRVELDLAKLQEDQKAFTIHASEANRLQDVVTKHRQQTLGLSETTAEQRKISEQSLLSAKETLEKSQWSESDDRVLLENTKKAKGLSQELDVFTRILADHGAANSRLSNAEKALQSHINIVQASESNPLKDASGVLTVNDVADVTIDLENKQKERDEAVGRKDAANEALKAASRKVDELSLRTAEQKHRLKLADDLARLRDTFRPNGASLEYLNYKFGKIARLAADYLAESGADFMVAPSEEIPLSYEFLRTDRSDEVWMPQSRMSGGQKVRLAVATLRAIHAMIMPEVGLLVLDEPTTHLDVEAQRSMADMLQQIGEEGTLQMIVCDHSTVLIDAFSDTIEIPD